MLNNNYSKATSDEEILFIPKQEKPSGSELSSCIEPIWNKKVNPNEANKSKTTTMIPLPRKQITRSNSQGKEKKLETEGKKGKIMTEHLFVVLNKDCDSDKGKLTCTKRKRCSVCSRKTRWHC